MTDDVRIEEIRFSGEQAPSGFGFRVGPVEGSVGSISINAAPSRTSAGAMSEPHTILGPITFDSDSSVDAGRVTARTLLGIENTPFQDLGSADVTLDLRIVEADGRAIGNIKRGLEGLQADPGSDPMTSGLEADARDLVAAGFELHIDEARISLPQGLIESELHVSVGESGSSSFSWPEALLAIDATADFSIAEDLVRLAMAANPDVGGIIGMGFLRKNGDVYELHAEFTKGRLTVNGAPMPIPLTGLQ
jgi:hypothetical protein